MAKPLDAVGDDLGTEEHRTETPTSSSVFPPGSGRNETATAGGTVSSDSISRPLDDGVPIDGLYSRHPDVDVVIAIVVSRADSASRHVGEHLLDLAEWTRRVDDDRPDADGGGAHYRTEGFELREFDDLHIYLEGAAGAFDDPDALVVVSRHAGETGALLTAHFTGNFGPAEFGGADGELARACPNAHAAVLGALREYAPGGYDVGMECTHHGPSDLDVPSMFVEVGSGEAQWSDPDAARAVARAVLGLSGTDPDRERTVVGFGGGHYAPRFERIVRETDWAVGHVAADWALDGTDGLDPRVIERAFERSKATRALIDGDRPDLAAAIEDLGYRVVSETWLRETEGVPLERVERAESTLRPIDDGLRFGRRADADGFRIEDPDEDLLADAHGVDPGRVREIVAAHAVAFETAENGNRPVGRIAVPGRDAYDDLLDAIAGLLGERYDDAERTPEGIVVHETAFDPDRARELGIPEGPAFGRLADGEPVEVDGETVTPEMVHVERRRSYTVGQSR